MPLTRHFYSVNEVEAALLYTTSHCMPDEALFWCKELIDSGYVGETISILFRSWIWSVGPMRLQWLIDSWKTLASDELTVDDILLATYRLASIPHNFRDSSLWNILVLTCADNQIPDRILRKGPKCGIPFEDEKEQYFIRAIYQGKARSAWWISRYIDNERIWILIDWFAKNVYLRYYESYSNCIEALKGYEKLLGYASEEFDIIMRLMGILMVCIQSERQEKSFGLEANEIDRLRVGACIDMDKSLGRITRRMYSIPKQSLYGISLRGKSAWTQNTKNQINNMEKNIIGCIFWDEAIAEFGSRNENGAIDWISDDKMEEFYNTYFPDDIPDEWSKKEKEKSHGDGILAPNEKITIYKYSRSMMPRVARLAWATGKEVLTYLEDLDFEDCLCLENIVKSFKPLMQLEDLKDLLKPVRKMKIV